MSGDPVDESETLDPEDWSAMRALAHRMVDDSFDQWQSVRDRPLWQPVPEAVARRFDGPAPRAPEGAQAAYDDFREFVQPYPLGNTHPRFWAWYMGNGTVGATLAEFLAAAMNPNLGGGAHAANFVEAQVVQWLKEMLGFPADASGLLVSGASMANLVGLTVARNTHAGADIRRHGVAAAPKPPTVYASTEVHSCNQKAVELLGLGSEALRRVPVRDDLTIDLAALQRLIDGDRAAGCQPICVIGSAGTVNTGAIDDLAALADLCSREGLWFHVDGAIGAVAVLADSVRPQLRGIERADSVALDLHKWMHMPFEAGAVLVRSEPAHRSSFSLTPEYLEHGTRGLAGGELWFSDYGVQLSRGFRALKVWMSIKEHGLDRFGRMIERNVAQARHLGERIAAEPALELVAPIGLDIVCFRYRPAGLDDAALDALNRELLLQLQEQGIAAPSYTTIGGRYCLRVAIANHRSRREDFDALVEAVLRLGAALTPGG